MKDFKTKFKSRFEDFREKYGPKVLSIAMHTIFVLMLLWSNGISSMDSDIPRYIEIRIGNPFNSGYTSNQADGSVSEQPVIPYRIWQASPMEEANEIEIKESGIVQQVSRDEAQQAEQKQEPVPQQKQVQVQPEQTAKQGAGNRNGNSNKGQESATYLEWLQLTVQELSEIPSQAREQNISGRAVLRLTFNRFGYVRNYWLVQGTGSKLLDAAALRVARRLVTEPFPPMPTDFEQGKEWVTYDFPISFKP